MFTNSKMFLIVGLIFLTHTNFAKSSERDAARDAAIAAIVKAKGRLVFHEDKETVRSIALSGKKVDDAIIPHIAAISELEYLKLYETSISDKALEKLKGLKNVKRLSISKGNFGDEGLAHIKDMDLESLLLVRTNVTDAGLAHLKGMKKLQKLSLKYCGRITDEGIKQIKNVQTLNQLDLGGTQITDDGLKHLQGLSNLKSLELYKTAISDAGLPHLERLPKLKWLMLKQSDVTKAGVVKFQKVLPNCRVPYSPRT